MNPPLFKGEVLRDRRATCPELPVGLSFGSVSQLVNRPPDARHQAKIRPPPTVAKLDRRSKIKTQQYILALREVHLGVWLSLGLILVADREIIHRLPLFRGQGSVNIQVFKHIEMGCQPVPGIIAILGNARDMALNIIRLDCLRAGGFGVGVGFFIPEVGEVDRGQIFIGNHD